MARRSSHNRDYYIVRFADENYKKEWKVGNLNRFLHMLWNSNEILRLENEIQDSERWVLRKQCSIHAKWNDKKRLIARTIAPISLVPTGSRYYSAYMITVEQCWNTQLKGLQE